MNALDQYIDLYKSHRDSIEEHSAGVLNAGRARALRILQEQGRLPEKGDEGYEKTSVNDMFAPDYGVNITRVKIPADVAASFHCGVPNLSSLLGLMVNDRFFPTDTLQKNLPEGVTVCSFKDAEAQCPGVLAQYGSVADPAGASTPTALNTLLAQDGVLVHVSRGVRVKKPLQLVGIFSSAAPLLAFRRMLVVLEEGASIAVLKCDHTQPSAAQCLSSEVVEIALAADAHLEWYDIEESNPSTSRMSQLYARQQSGSELHICASTLTNGTSRNEFDIVTEGNHTHTTLNGMIIGSGNQHVDNSSQLTHAGEHSHSSQMFKYVLDESATGAFEGGIEVCHGARFTEAYQSNKNILASRDARMHSKPQLLIYNDDVKCSHGATTGQLNQNALFYMQQRGIPLEEARKMLMQAFMVDVIDSIALEPLRDRLRHMVERRFAGDCASSCAGCAS